MTEQAQKPRWVRDLLRYLPLKSQFVLTGNIRDHQAFEMTPGSFMPQPLVAYLATELSRAGFEHVISFNPVHGFRSVEIATGNLLSESSILKELRVDGQSNTDAKSLMDVFANTIERIVVRPGLPVALIADFASRMINRPDSLHASEQHCFTRSLVLSHDVRTRPCGTPPKPFYNSVIWIADKEGDLPDWFLINNPRIRHIPIAKPDHTVRRQMAESLIRSQEGFKTADAEAVSKAVKTFVEGTEDMLLVDMSAISQLCRAEQLHLSKIGDAVRHYKLGVTEDPWQKIDKEKIRAGRELIAERLKGQEHAVVHVLDVIKRAVTGVAASKRGGRPRGVAFFAGPTGVGKTELAKTVTQLLFGDESAYIRFDMSEFSAEHSDQRLIGSPPGYVGYDVGGELTNAIREKPFSVVLFDEIEKAHPRILDKFLQILDDGVLTSGRGDRVYFSEAFIIFTSNLGIYKTNNLGERVQQVGPDESFSAITQKIRHEIDQHFKLVLGRPEILNRIGENIIVFDFIRDEVATRIFDQMVATTLTNLETSQGIKVQLGDDVMSVLRELCLADLSNGGRGIRNKLEAHLVNPLARALFDGNVARGASVRVCEIESDTLTTLKLGSLVCEALT